MKKIIVIGCPGSGKSTFSRMLNKVIDIPVYHLDNLFWNADKTTKEKNVFLKSLNDTIQKDEWIIDGNFNSTLELRLQACDTVIFLDYPLEVCLDGIEKRRGKPRSDIPWIEVEEDKEFIEFIKNFNKQIKPQIIDLLNQYSNKNRFIFKNRNEAHRFLWELEEKQAFIHGWDFSHINDRYDEQEDLPWSYYDRIKTYLKDDMKLLDYDTGGGEFLLTLNHPYENTFATEGYKPNVELCKEVLLPLGIHFKECNDASQLPFDKNSFDIMINRHGDFDAHEIYRVLKKDGIFITQQVGEENDRDLVEMVLPNTPKPFPHMNLKEQKEEFVKAGFEIIEEGEVYRPIRFYDIGAFVWFAHIIEWEFNHFSVEKCFDKLLDMQRIIDKKGYIEGTIHRYLIVARKG